MATNMSSIFILAMNVVSGSASPILDVKAAPAPIGGNFGMSATVTLKSGAVSPEAYKQSSDPDDTASIQRAIDTCRTVQLSGGKTYHVSSTIYLCKGGHQKVAGIGPSSVVKVSSRFHGRTSCSDSVGTHWNAVFANFNCAASTITDIDIEFANFSLDNSANVAEERWLIAIFNRSTRYVYIHGILCNTFADCSATLHSSETTVADSVAINNFNAGFDAWDSPSNMTVRNTTVYCNFASASYGLLYNAANTNATLDGTATGFTAIGNKQFGCAPGIMIDPLTTKGLVQDVNISNNLQDNFNLTTSSAGGITISGHVSHVKISGATLRNMKNGQLYVGQSGVPNDAGLPDHVTIVRPRFINIRNPSGVLLDVHR